MNDEILKRKNKNQANPIKSSECNMLSQSALLHTEKLLSIGARGSTTDNEHKASKYVHDYLTKIGLKPNWEEFQSPKSAWLPYALCFIIPVFAFLLSSWNHPIGISGTITSTILGIWWLYKESQLERTLLNRIIPQGKSQNVFAKIPAINKPIRRIVLLAHVDTHRTPIFFSRKGWGRLFAVNAVIALVSLFAEICIYLLIAVWNINISLFWVAPFLLAQLTFSILLFHPEFTDFSPGANDNAASVGVVLALAEYFHNHPLENIEVIALATGCEEVGCYGIRDFLPKHVTDLYNAIFIDFELVGIGSPSLLAGEGLLLKQQTDKKLICLFREVFDNLGMKVKVHKSRVYGETYVINKLGFNGITLNCVPEENTDRYWHTKEDTLDKIQANSLEATINIIDGFVKNLESKVKSFLPQEIDEIISEYGKIELEHALTKIRDIEGRRLQIAGLVLAGVSAALTYAFSEKLAGIIIIGAFISLAHLFIESTENRQIAAAYSIAIRYSIKFEQGQVDYNRLYLSSILYSSQKLRKLLRALEESALSQNVFESGTILGKHYEKILSGPVGTSALFVILSVILIGAAIFLTQISGWAWF